jgi:hypothetical protein
MKLRSIYFENFQLRRNILRNSKLVINDKILNFEILIVTSKTNKIMGLIREPLNIDLVINSNANAQELEKIDSMIQKLKSESVVKYDSLDDALKFKNDSARSYLKTAKLP